MIFVDLARIAIPLELSPTVTMQGFASRARPEGTLKALATKREPVRIVQQGKPLMVVHWTVVMTA